MSEVEVRRRPPRGPRPGSERRFVRAVAAAVAVPALLGAASGAVRGQALEYPETEVREVVEDYHGTEVADPYRWLEDTDSPETRAWIEAQNEVTFGYLERIPFREAIRARLTELWDYEKYDVPFKDGGLYFFRKNDGLQNQSVLYVQESLAGEPRALLDPNRLSEDGTVALTAVDVSEDGRHLAYGTAAAGSDWQEFHVRRVDTGEDLEDRLRWIKFSGMSWTRDGAGFFYSRYPEPTGEDTLLATNRNQKVYYHRVGTPQSEDLLVYARPDEPEWGFDASVTDDGRYLTMHVWHGTDERNRFYYTDLGDPESPDLDADVVRLLDDFDASYALAGNDGSTFFFVTNLDAPRYRLVAIDRENPDRGSWRELVPEREEVLGAASVIGGKLVLRYLRDARSVLRIHDLDGGFEREVELPVPGTAWGVTGHPDEPEFFFGFTSFLYPATVFRGDVETGEIAVFRAPDVDFDPAAYETRQVFYTSKDGTRVPMFLTHRRDLSLDGTNPTLLYGYGGFNISMTPGFSVANLVWLEMGGVYAMANLRGGGEYGEVWHRAGTLERKQNVFDDFIAAAEWLVDEGYTSPARLAIMGGSNGGLLVGAAMTQRPDLFGVALPAVGVMDMLRYHEFTIGWAWASDYGTSDDPEMFPYLHAYSPYHNLEPGTCYPATLVTTADHDDRVVPGHSFKFAARLQAAQACDAPTLIRIETRAGHGAGKPTDKVIAEAADKWAFTAYRMGLDPFPSVDGG